MPQFCLLGLSGSLRRASNSTAVLRGLRDALGLRAALDIFPLHAIPLYNEDDDAGHRGGDGGEARRAPALFAVEEREGDRE